jgi:hypothetical protein
VLAKAQQIVMNFWVLDDVKLLNILLDGMGLGAHERIDKFGCANGYTHAFQARYSDDIKLGFCKILFIEFTETLERVVMVDVLEHKFASSLSGDTGDVDFDFGHVETQFRVLSKPLAHLNQHLEGAWQLRKYFRTFVMLKNLFLRAVPSSPSQKAFNDSGVGKFSRLRFKDLSGWRSRSFSTVSSLHAGIIS